MMPAQQLLQLPRAAQPFVVFQTLLRANGFSVSPDQTIAFVEAVGLLRAHSMTVIQRAAHATLAPPHERIDEFNALFRMFFAGQSIAAPAFSEAPEDEMQVFDDSGRELDVIEPESVNEVGEQASRGESLSVRRFAPVDESSVLRRFRRAAPDTLPMRRSLRRARMRRGDKYDLRRSLRDLVSRDGEILRLIQVGRQVRQRRITLLLDISGSMKAQTDQYLRFAHTLARVAQQLEVFTLGTRLTRLTPALRLRNRDRALERAAANVADWDGGTRIGEALGAMLSIPRYADFTRGALVVVLSDGLERGNPAALIEAMRRLAQRTWKIVWLSPLAAETNYQPRTEAMQAIAHYIDHLGDGSSVQAICSTLINLAKEKK